MGMDRETKVHCVGGWAFTLIGVGLFMLVPSTILIGVFSNDNMSAEEITAIVLFSCTFAFLVLGCCLLIYWCRSTELGQVKGVDGESGAAGTSGNSSGGGGAKPQSNGDAN